MRWGQPAPQLLEERKFVFADLWIWFLATTVHQCLLHLAKHSEQEPEGRRFVGTDTGAWV